VVAIKATKSLVTERTEITMAFIFSGIMLSIYIVIT
jgi:hypothetical protein